MDSHIDQVHSTVKSLIVDPLSQDIKLAHDINVLTLCPDSEGPLSEILLWTVLDQCVNP